MQNQNNNKKKYLVAAAIILLALILVWLIMNSTKQTSNDEFFEKDTGYGISTKGTFKYQDNVLEWNSSPIELENDIVNVSPSEDKLLIYTTASENYPNGRYIIYQDKNKIADLPSNTSDAKWVGKNIFYVVTEAGKSIVYSQLNQKITSIPYEYASLIPAGDNFILSYTTDTDQVEHIYYNKKTNTQSRLFVPEGFMIVCSSDDLKHLFLAPVHGPDEPYQLYSTQKKELKPVGNNLAFDSIKWIEDKGFISIWKGSHSLPNDKLVLISIAGEQKILYESDKELESIAVAGNKVLIITSEGEQLQVEI